MVTFIHLLDSFIYLHSNKITNLHKKHTTHDNKTTLAALTAAL